MITKVKNDTDKALLVGAQVTFKRNEIMPMSTIYFEPHNPVEEINCIEVSIEVK